MAKDVFCENYGKRMEKKKYKGGIIIATAIVFTAIFAVLLGISVYNAPARHLAEQLDLGNRYLEEMDYEQAMVAFGKAIKIDPKSTDAYLGKARAYSGMSDMDMVIETLEIGMNQVAEINDIKKELVNAYLSVAQKKLDDADYEESLKFYDRLIELGDEDGVIIENLCACIDAYIEFLIEERRYVEILKLREKYNDIAINVDFEFYLEIIEKLRAKEALEDESNSIVEMQKADTNNLLECVNENRKKSRNVIVGLG